MPASSTVTQVGPQTTGRDVRDRVFLAALLAHVPILIVVGAVFGAGTWLHILAEALAPA